MLHFRYDFIGRNFPPSNRTEATFHYQRMYRVCTVSDRA
jgi:hypothetical protein